MDVGQPDNLLEDQHKISVLIADDDAPTRMLLRAAISQWGYDIAEAKDGEEAWLAIQQANAPQLLIVDWLMPKLNGIDLCERIKQQLSQNTYIILLTQQTGTTNLVKGLEAGADEFLSKPFNMAELRSRMSIGSRILRYENFIIQQNQKLIDYFSKTEQLSHSILDTFNKINSEQAKEQSAEVTVQVKQLTELHNKIRTIIDVIKKFRFENIKGF